MTDENEPVPKQGLEEEKKPPGLEPEKPPPDEFLGRGTKNKKKEKKIKQRPAKTQVEEQIDAALAQSALQTKRVAQRKKLTKFGLAGLGIILLVYLIQWGLKPYTAGMAYGICKVFLENSVRYPQSLRVSTVEELETSVRIWYTQVDSFGEYRMQQIQCYYKQDPEHGTMVDKILIDRREVDPKQVEDFNRVLSVVMQHPPDLTIPAPLPDSLQDLQIDSTAFRRPVL